uniref:Uncharacterized protein n=1 Tax=Anguilla anguilla TaxID=7936 RepID=A0A0E9TZA2_ANGAN
MGKDCSVAIISLM